MTLETVASDLFQNLLIYAEEISVRLKVDLEFESLPEQLEVDIQNVSQNPENRDTEFS